MRRITLLFLTLCILVYAQGQDSQDLESATLLDSLPSVSGILNNYDKTFNKDLHVNYTLQTPDFMGVRQGRVEIAEDGSFKIDLTNHYLYQKINLKIGAYYQGVIIAHSNSKVVVDLNAVMSKSDNFSSKAVSFEGNDGPLVEYYNAFINYKAEKKSSIRREKFSALRNRTSHTQFKVKQLRSFFEELEKIENVFAKKKGKEHQWLLKNERQSEFYADLVSIFVGKPIPKELWKEVLSHKPVIVSELSNRYYGVLAAKIWSHDEKEIRAFSRLVFKSEAASEKEKKEIDLFMVEQDKKNAGVSYDNEVYAKGVQDYVDKFETKLAEAKLQLFVEKLKAMPEGKLGLVAIKGQPLDLLDRQTYINQTKSYIKIAWQRDLIQEECKQEQGRINRISGMIQNAPLGGGTSSLGTGLEVLTTGAKLSKVSGGGIEKLLQSLRSFYNEEAVVIYVWDPNCSSCADELKNSGLTYDRVEGLPLHIVTLAIGQDNSQAKWKQIIQTSVLQGDHLLLDNALSSEIIEYFQLPQVPAFFYLSADGTFDPYKVSSISDLDVKEIVIATE